ncbi:MAG: DUF5063 domain-containing protein [Steroidobacteraceae bacterium]
MASAVLQQIREVLEVVEDTSRSESDSIEALEAALDRLAAGVHTVWFELDSADYPDPPSEDPTSLHQRVAQRFPSFGYYNTPLDTSHKISETELAVGDAINDIAEICGDLRENIWRFQNTSEADALFHFQLGYRSHWGRHLRELQLYVHDRHW